MWDDDDFNFVYKIRFTRWSEKVGTRLFIGLRWNTVSTSANGEITNNAAVSIDLWYTSGKRTVAFFGQNTVCTSHGELTLSTNTDYYFHFKREGNVETLKITSGSIDGTVLKQATGTISGDKRPANYLQIGNQNTATSQIDYLMSGTLHDVTPEPPSWKKYHSVISQITSESLPQWYKYHTMTSTIGVEAYQWLKYHTAQITFGIVEQWQKYHTMVSQFTSEIVQEWNRYHTMTSTIGVEVYQWIKYHTVHFTSEVVEFGFEVYHKMASRINSFSEIMHTSAIMTTLMLLFVPSLVAYAVIGRYGLLFVLSAMTAVMVLNDPSTIITGFIVWSTATVIIWRGYR
jgi:hemerythrin